MAAADDIGKAHDVTLPEEWEEEEAESPAEEGEEASSGSAPSVESDDDVDEMMEEVGMETEDKEGRPKEVGIAGQVEKDELQRRGKLPPDEEEEEGLE